MAAWEVQWMPACDGVQVSSTTAGSVFLKAFDGAQMSGYARAEYDRWYCECNERKPSEPMAESRPNEVQLRRASFPTARLPLSVADLDDLDSSSCT